MLEICEELRLSYADYPELYDLARERERVRPGPLQYRGNTSDLRQWYMLRVLVHETEKRAYQAFCRWSGRLQREAEVLSQMVRSKEARKKQAGKNRVESVKGWVNERGKATVTHSCSY